jgi:hypothetical protein
VRHHTSRFNFNALLIQPLQVRFCKGSNTTTTQSGSTPNPVALSAYDSLIGQAQNIAQTPFSPYANQQVAGFTPEQKTAVGGINSYANAAQPGISAAEGLVGQSTGLLSGAAGLYQNAAQPLTQGQIQQFMSPYTADVVNATEQQFNLQNAQQQNQLVGNAAAQNALGGNRVGVAQAQLAGQQQANEAPVIAGLYNQAYTTGLGTAEQEFQQNPMAAAAGLGNTAAGFNNAAYGLGSLATAGQSAGLQGAGAQFQAGTAQQQTQQAIDTNAFNYYLMQAGYPEQMLNWESGIVSGVGSLMGGTGYSTTTGPPPNQTAQYLGLGLGALGVFSDRRLKENIRIVGHLKDGQPVYRYNYKGDPNKTVHVGLMADQVRKSHPEAVHRYGGFDAVNYGEATKDAAKRARGGVAGLGAPPAYQYGGAPMGLGGFNINAGPYGETGMPYGGGPTYVPTIQITHGSGPPQVNAPGLPQQQQAGAMSPNQIMQLNKSLQGFGNTGLGQALGMGDDWAGGGEDPSLDSGAILGDLGDWRGGRIPHFAVGGSTGFGSGSFGGRPLPPQVMAMLGRSQGRQPPPRHFDDGGGVDSGPFVPDYDPNAPHVVGGVPQLIPSANAGNFDAVPIGGASYNPDAPFASPTIADAGQGVAGFGAPATGGASFGSPYGGTVPFPVAGAGLGANNAPINIPTTPGPSSDSLGMTPQADQSGANVSGSWFGTYSGDHDWRDNREPAGHPTASGIPPSAPGIALPTRSTLGQRFVVTAPNGQSIVVPQTDVGPGANGRGVDLTAAAAEKLGYSPSSFPTDGKFNVRPFTGHVDDPQPANSTSPSMDTAMGKNPVAANGATVPNGVLQDATYLVKQGANSSQLQNFMARNGYPMSGNWCGEFAADVVHAMGGQPPNGAAVATNWLHWGRSVDPSQIAANDAVIFPRGHAPGETGGHVGFVSQVYADGSFDMTGGNQGQAVKHIASSDGAVFRRGDYSERVLGESGGTLAFDEANKPGGPLSGPTGHPVSGVGAANPDASGVAPPSGFGQTGLLSKLNFLGLAPEERQGLISAGMGMLASRSPFLGVAVGEGAQAGLGAYAQATTRDLAVRRLGIEADKARAAIALQGAQAENLRTTGAINRAKLSGYENEGTAPAVGMPPVTSAPLSPPPPTQNYQPRALPPPASAAAPSGVGGTTLPGGLAGAPPLGSVPRISVGPSSATPPASPYAVRPETGGMQDQGSPPAPTARIDPAWDPANLQRQIDKDAWLFPEKANSLKDRLDMIVRSGRTRDVNGNMIPLPGVNESEASLAAAKARAEAQAKAPYQFKTVQDASGREFYVSEADLARRGGAPGGATLINPGPGSPPGQSFDGATANLPAKQPEVLKERQQAIAKDVETLGAQFRGRPAIRERLQEIQELLKTYQTGKFSEEKANLVAMARGFGIPVASTDTANPEAFERFLKNQTANIFAQVKDIGGRVLVSEIQGLTKANANPDLQPEANRAIVGQAIGLLNYEDQYYHDFMTEYRAHPYMSDTSAFDEGWIKDHPLSTYTKAAQYNTPVKGEAVPAAAQREVGKVYLNSRGQAGRWNGRTWDLVQ